MAFYDRKRELDFFRNIKNNNQKKFIVMYGRRRIGKTTLIKNVFSNENEEDFLYHFVEVTREESQLKKISEYISKATYNDWYNLFYEIFQKKKIIVFDEFQNFSIINENIYSALQHAWDDTEKNVKLVVLGSYVGLMKKLFTEKKLPLFGRNDYIIRLKEFPKKESLKILTDYGYSHEEAIEIILLVGGIPKYLLAFKDKTTLKKKIYNLFIGDFSPFKEETKNILIQEFGVEHKSYFSILKGIAGKRKSLSELTDITGIPNTSLSKYLVELEREYEIIEKSNPLLSKKIRDKKYKIKDPMYNFFYNVIDRYFSDFEFDKEKTWERVFPLINNHYGIMFENFCIEYIKENPEILPFVPEKIGKNWGKIPGKRNESYDIDIIAYDEENVLFGECKWTNTKIGIRILNNLKERASYLNIQNKKIYYILFSKKGFTEELEKLENKNLLLISPGDF